MKKGWGSEEAKDAVANAAELKKTFLERQQQAIRWWLSYANRVQCSIHTQWEVMIGAAHFNRANYKFITEIW